MHIITTTQQLNEFIEDINKQAAFVAIDTEFKRKNTYFPQLCLIQLATEFSEAVIDPLAIDIDLSAFFTLMQNTKILKVFFAARQDIEAIFYLNHTPIAKPIFDCQIASMLCGYANNLSFQALVYDLLGIIIDKSMQQTDWTKRPLEPAQIEYALKDATLLCKIYKLLCQKLHQINRLDWLKEEFDHLVNVADYAELKVGFNYKKQSDFLLHKQLLLWREKYAQELNLPRNWIIKDALLNDIVLKKPAIDKELTKLLNEKNAKLPQKINSYEILQILQIKSPVSNDNYEYKIYQKSPKLASLQALLKNISDKENIAPSLIATTNSLNKLIDDPTNHATLKGWRYKIFGQFAIELIKTKGAK